MLSRLSTAAGRSIFAIDRHDAPGFAHQSMRMLDVVGRLHEAQRHEIDAKRQAEAQVGGVLLGHG